MLVLIIVEQHSSKRIWSAKMSLIFVQILLILSLCKNGFAKSRVNQGMEIDIEDAPYMARLQVLLNATLALGCDASILSEWFLLTAGHCKNNFLLLNNVSFPGNFHFVQVLRTSLTLTCRTLNCMILVHLRFWSVPVISVNRNKENSSVYRKFSSENTAPIMTWQYWNYRGKLCWMELQNWP